MDDFFTFAPGKFCVIQDWLEKRRAKYLPGRDGRVGNTSIFRFNLRDIIMCIPILLSTSLGHWITFVSNSSM